MSKLTQKLAEITKKNEISINEHSLEKKGGLGINEHKVENNNNDLKEKIQGTFKEINQLQESPWEEIKEPVKKVSKNNNEEKLKQLEEPIKEYDMDSVKRSTINGTIKVFEKGIKRKKTHDVIQVTHVTKEQFLDYKTFIPIKGNMATNIKLKNTAVHITPENELFLRSVAYKHGVRMNSVVNHFLDIVKTYFPELNKI